MSETEMSNLNEIRQRAFRANHRDGLMELSLGIPIAIFGIGVVSGDDAWMLMGNILLPLAIIGLIPIKNAITVPRIGHVEVPRALPMKSQVILLSVMVIMSIGMFLLMGANRETAQSIGHYFPLLVGFGMAAFLIVMGRHYSTKRWIWLGAFAALAGLTLVFLDLPVRKNEGPLLMVIGAAMLLTGGFTLFNFLRTCPVINTEEDQS